MNSMAASQKHALPLLASLLWAALGYGVISVSGCAVIAPKDEYAAYKTVRLASDADTRLRAGRLYLDGFAGGMWVSQVGEELALAEVPLFEKRGAERGGLELYLEVYPNGVFSEQARARLGALDTVTRRQRSEEARVASVEEAASQRAEQLRRTWIGRFAGEWLALFAGLNGWGEGLAAVASGSPEFSQVFGKPPKPRCTREACLKFYTATYSVPVPGATRLERTAQVLVRLRMVAGKLERAEILLPGWGFSRWSEMQRRALVLDTEPAQRAEAVSWAKAQLVRRLGTLKGFKSLGPLAPEEIGALMSSWTPPAISPSGELIDPGVAHLEEVTPVLGGRAIDLAPRNRNSRTGSALPPQPREAEITLPLLRIAADGSVRTGPIEQGANVVSPAAAGQVVGKARITPLNRLRAPGKSGQWGAEKFRVGGLSITLFSAPVAILGMGGGADIDGLLIEPTNAH